MTKKSKTRRLNEEFHKSRTKAVENICSLLNSQKGHTVRINESISRNPPSKDRHCTTLTILEMEIENVVIQFSGAQITIYGIGNLQYGISMDMLCDWRIHSDKDIELTERLSQALERYTRLSISSGETEKQ